MGKKPKKPRYKIWKTILLTIISIFVLTAVAMTGVVIAMINTAPQLDVNQVLTLSETSTLYDDKDQFMDVVITNQQRTVISIKDVPQDLKNAFVSIEDERFYKHKGIDLKRITGSVYMNVLNKIKGKSGLQGGSTITQQLLKNTILTPELSIKRKVQEIYLSLKLEKYLSKDQILEAYMNTIFLGGKAMGIETAANQYFNKKAIDLSLIECAFLAGIPQSPSVYYPFSPAAKKDPSIYLNRTKTVLTKMYENNYITKEKYDVAINDLNNKKLVIQPPSSTSNNLNYEWFSLPAIDQVKKDLKAEYRYSDDEIDRMLLYGGVKIYTTMNKEMQDAATRTLNDTSLIPILSKKNNIVQPQASAVIMDYKTGQVKTIIGGRGAQPPRSYNRAASDKYLRPPGSSIKPLTVYSAAIDSNLATAATAIDDSPLSPEIGKQYGSSNKPYNPKNDDGIYRGYTTIRNAITHSVNVVAVKLEHEIGLKTGIAYGEKYGLTLNSNDRTSISALALGQLSQGTTPLTMAAAYGTFGNNGTYTSPKLYKVVKDRTGKVLLDSKPSTKKIISPQTAYIMYDLLKGPVSNEGTAPSANFNSMPVRGKTGTSSDSRDLWFSGLTPYYSGAVWIGNDDNSSLEGSLNSNRAAAVWARLMEPFHQNLSPKDIEQPSGIVTATVCMDSGKLATDFCRKDPRGNRTITEIFAEGSLPKDYCDIHVEAKINKLTGKLASELTPPFLTESKVFIKKPAGDSDENLQLPGTTDNSAPQQPIENNDNNLPPSNNDKKNKNRIRTKND